MPVNGGDCGIASDAPDVFYEYQFQPLSGNSKRVIANLCGDETTFKTALYVLKKNSVG